MAELDSPVFTNARIQPSASTWIMIGATVLLLARLPCALLEPEESRYAEIPRQMLAKGQFLTPILHGQPYLHKPPLLYWLVMAGYLVLGVHDWVARLIPIGAALLTVIAVDRWARQRSATATAWAAALVLALAPGFMYRAPFLTMDGLLTLWVIVALALAETALTAGMFRRKSWLLSALACGLGILTKGPVAGALVIVPLAAFVVIRRRGTQPEWKDWLLYVGVVLGVAGPWLLAIGLAHPEAAAEFFWLHNVQRYLVPFDHARPVWFYVPELAIGMLPWSVALIPLLWRDGRAFLRGSMHSLPALALFWCVIFFSLSGCKRAGYILPALPLWALLVGPRLAEGTFLFRGRPGLRPVAAGMFVLLLTGTLLWLPGYHRAFSLREPVCQQQHWAEGLAIACYPHRWDSVSFYLQQSHVEAYAPEDHSKMLADLHARPATLLFVKARCLEEFEALLPPSLEFVPRPSCGANVVPGLVRPRLGARCRNMLDPAAPGN